MLEGDKLRIRALEPEDLGVLYKWENQVELWSLSNTSKPFSKYVLKQYLKTAHLDIYATKQVRFMIEKINNNQCIGAIDLFDYDPKHQRAGVGIVIGEKSEHGKGYATEALRLLVKYGFEIIHLHQLYCNIEASNARSLNLFQKAGFEISGAKKQWNFDGVQWEDELLLQFFNPSKSGR